MSRSHEIAIVRWFGDRLGPLEGLIVTSRPWHSATFSGARYELFFSAAVELSAAAIAESEIVLGKGFVADIAASVTRAAETNHYRIALLVIDED